MTEHVVNHHEIYVTPPPTPVEQLVTALEVGDYRAAADANVHYVDAVLPEAQHRNHATSVYTEIHAVDDGIVFAPSVEDSHALWAHPMGYHSMFDATTRDNPNTPARRLEAELASRLTLTTDSLLGKGKITLAPDGQYDLEIIALSGRGEHDLSWLNSLAERSEDYQSTRFTYKPYKTTVEQQLYGELPVVAHTEIQAQQVQLAEAVPGYQTGVVTGVKCIELPHVERNQAGELQRSAELILEAVEGKAQYHQPLYDAMKLKRPGLFTVKTDTFEQQLAVHYVIDKTYSRGHALITYNNKPGTKPPFELCELVHMGISKYLKQALPDSAQVFVNEYVEQVDFASWDN